MKRDIALTSCRCVQKQSQNVQFTWLTTADKLSMLKNVYWGHRELPVLQKIFVQHFNEMPSSWGSSAMPCHFTHDLCQAFEL